MTASTAKPETVSVTSGAPAAMVPASAFPGLAARTAGAGPAFVLLHGGAGSSAHWVRNIDALADKFRVVAFDLPGYGDSPDVPKSMKPDMYIDWVCHAVTTAAPDGCHSVGFSFGGALAARVAAQLGNRVIRLSLLGAGGFGVPVGRSHSSDQDTEVLSTGPQARRAAQQPISVNGCSQARRAADDPVVDMQLANIDRTRFDSRRISLKSTLLDDLARITAPVQLIWGTVGQVGFSVRSIARRQLSRGTG